MVLARNCSSLDPRTTVKRLRQLDRALGVYLLSSKSGAATEWLSLKREAKVLLKSDVRTEPAPLLPDEESRARLARIISADKLFSKLPERLARGLSFAFSLIPSKYNRVVKMVLDAIHIPRLYCEDTVLDLLKKLGTLAKKYGDTLFPGYWKFLIDWNVAAGYKVTDESEFAAELPSWLCSKWELRASPDDWANLRKGCSMFLSQGTGVVRANENAQTIEEWSSDPANWGRAGSTMEKGGINTPNTLEWTDGGEWHSAPRSKWRTALETDPTIIEDILYGKRWKQFRGSRVGQLNKAIAKREATKVRAVVSSDEYLYIRMSYVSRWLESALAGNKLSPLFMGLAKRLRMWEDLGMGVQTQSWNMPLDQSHFDWHVSFKMLDAAVNSIAAFIRRRACDKVRYHLLLVLRQIKSSLTSSSMRKILIYTVNNKEHISSITSGVASGWRWTALLDTILNYGELFAVSQGVSRIMGIAPIIQAYVQGDDDAIRAQSVQLCYGIFYYYQDLGLEVSAGKTFVDRHRDEFLRQVITVSGAKSYISGYPIRLINSLLWKNPVNEPDEVKGVNQIVPRAALWRKLFCRGVTITDELRKLIVNDLWRCTGKSFRKGDIVDWINTPASIGGAGGIWEPGRVGSTAFVQEKRRNVCRWRGSASGLARLEVEASKFGVSLDPGTIFNSVLDPPSKGEVSSPAYFKQVAHPPVLRKDFSPGKPMSVRWLCQHSWINDALLKKAKELRDPLWLCAYLSPGSATHLTTLSRCCRRSVVWDWLSGDISWPVGWDGASGEEYVSEITGSHFWGWLRGKTGSRGINRSTIVRAAYSWESTLQFRLGLRRVVIGA